MLVETQYLSNSKKLVVSYVDKSGEIKLKYYNWETPMKYVACEDNDPQKHPDFKSWDGKSVKQIDVSHPDRYATYEFLDSLPESEKNEIFEFNLPKIFFIDIETEIVDGFPEAADIKDVNGNVTKEGASTQVLSISIVYDDKIILLGLKEMPEDMQERIKDNTNKYFEKFGSDYKFKYIKYDDEFDMLYAFFYKMIPKMPILTGWNFLNYDWLYLVNRSRKISKWANGKEYKIDPAVSSLTKKMNKIWSTEFEVPAHRMIFDYMQLYEVCDTSIKVKESSSLDFVASKLVGVEKIKYNGSLQKLYEDDFETFMYYNAVDSVLVQKIHEARNYISIIYAISSLAQIRIVDVVSQMNNALGSLAITEGVLRNRFREMDNIVLFRDEKGDAESTIAGGWVKDPVVGLNQWVVCYDFASLYPTTQRTVLYCS
jgi:DNA polymerase elongation subunit (family B)